MAKDTKTFGKFGEDFTAKYLKSNGYKILAQNFPQFIFPHSTAPVEKNQRQELILAVISRTLFWIWESPAFRAVSTLRMS